MTSLQGVIFIYKTAFVLFLATEQKDAFKPCVKDVFTYFARFLTEIEIKVVYFCAFS